MTLASTNPAKAARLKPAYWEPTKVPAKQEVYCGGQLYATVEQKPGGPRNHPSEDSRYLVELTPPPTAVDGLTKEEAIAFAEGYAQLMEHLFGEI